MLSQYGGVGMDAIRQWRKMPMVTIIRLMGCAKKRLNPQSVAPGADTDPETDADMVALLEKRIKAQRK